MKDFERQDGDPGSQRLVDAVMAETVGMILHNAVTAQQNSQMISTAAVAATCARILAAQTPPPPKPPDKKGDSSDKKALTEPAKTSPTETKPPGEAEKPGKETGTKGAEEASKPESIPEPDPSRIDRDSRQAVLDSVRRIEQSVANAATAEERLRDAVRRITSRAGIDPDPVREIDSPMN